MEDGWVWGRLLLLLNLDWPCDFLQPIWHGRGKVVRVQRPALSALAASTFLSERSQQL